MYNLGYKIIEMTEEGDPKFMFCGLNGSRKIELDTWLKAEIKTVKDGTTKTEYESGFHVLPSSMEMAKQYIKKFKNRKGKFLIPVLYDNARRKPTKGSLALLARGLRVNSEFLAQAIEISEL
jgi:hypothetical protein